jgi:hypothetical protein
VLGRQRDRWHRGLAQVLTLHRRMLLNPRYGSAGMVGMPFFTAAELRAGREREVTPLDGVAEAVVFEAWSVAQRGQAPVAGRVGVRGGIGHVSGAPLTRWSADLGLFVRF